MTKSKGHEKPKLVIKTKAKEVFKKSEADKFVEKT